MCDTIVVPPSVSGGPMLFAKNSDREGGEAQAVEIRPRRTHAPGARLHATNLSLPQVYETAATLLCRPYWLWGAEMGVNEYGLAIGNEAVFSRVAPEAGPTLTGMDLVRLGLERARGAAEAAQVLITLIAAHGQGGNGGQRHHFPYDSAFLIADPREAFVLEAAGRHWALERVAGIRALSNHYSITSRYERLSDGAKEFARGRGWWSGQGAFDFSAAFARPLLGLAGRGRQRAARACALLARAPAGGIGLTDLMRLLRDHSPAGERPGWQPGGLLPATICAHGSAGPAKRAAQTTMSLVAGLERGLPALWATGGAAPCTALFRPFFIEAGMPAAEPAPTDRFDPACLWWRQERLHHAVVRDHAARLAAYGPARDALEAALVEEVERARAQAATRSAPERRRLLGDVARAAWTVAEDALARWTRIAEGVPIEHRPGPIFRYHRRQLSRRADIQNG
ncbi:peptidase family C69 [Zavarzinia compransoris]|uniref:Peptidase family C69 n=1 Tax=Zavarzinia compransoris TaxID=1264899 RepID=A0A317EBH0_9PROT|nr:peptidase family C69 [Zavarzinia compransoris]PWR23566.1 peptidase family C69 [Zavarzinia compransoris]TDP47778.1 dipeptidase [Zavarzinia compransoris]